MTSRKKRKQPQMWQRSCCAGAAGSGLFLLSPSARYKSHQLEMCHVIHHSCSILLHQDTFCTTSTPQRVSLHGVLPHISIPSHYSEVTVTVRPASCQGWQSGCHQKIQRAAGQMCWQEQLARWNNGLEELQGHQWCFNSFSVNGSCGWVGIFDLKWSPLLFTPSSQGQEASPLILPPGSTLLDKHLPWLCLVWNCTDCASHAEKWLIVQNRHLEPVRSCHPERYFAIQIAKTRGRR